MGKQTCLPLSVQRLTGTTPSEDNRGRNRVDCGPSPTRRPRIKELRNVFPGLASPRASPILDPALVAPDHIQVTQAHTQPRVWAFFLFKYKIYDIGCEHRGSRIAYRVSRCLHHVGPI